MMEAQATRREFLSYVGYGIGPMLVGIPGFSSVALAQNDLTVRRDVGSLPADGSTLASYASAVTALKERPEDDPTSWIFQANIHGSFDDSNPAWNQCQHGSFFFLSWHRMYLYFFERIVRAASGDPTFALPYWNYRLPAQRQLPEPFRRPDDAATNPLFIEERNPAANAGGVLPESSVLHDEAFSFSNFASPPGSGQGLGGQEVPGFTHFGQPHGELESQPHDVIHVLIGGRSGFMADPRLAARDPIFWLHHANVDRLWSRWLDLGNGRANPVDNGAWANTSFSFFDEDGNEVELSGREVVETAAQLDYRYDDDPAVPPGDSEPCPEDQPLTESASEPRLLMESAGAVKLDSRQISVGVAARQESSATLLENVFRDETRRHALIMRLEGIKYEEQPGVYYEVYINLPEDGGEPSYRDKQYVGNVSFFAMQRDHGALAEGVRTFDITRVIDSLRVEESWSAERIEVSFVKRGIESELELDEETPQVTIEQINVIREKRLK